MIFILQYKTDKIQQNNIQIIQYDKNQTKNSHSYRLFVYPIFITFIGDIMLDI